MIKTYNRFSQLNEDIRKLRNRLKLPGEIYNKISFLIFTGNARGLYKISNPRYIPLETDEDYSEFFFEACPKENLRILINKASLDYEEFSDDWEEFLSRLEEELKLYHH